MPRSYIPARTGRGGVIIDLYHGDKQFCEQSLVCSKSLASCCREDTKCSYLPLAVHYLDNTLLGVYGLDKVWLGHVWLVYSVCNIKCIIKGPLSTC